MCTFYCFVWGLVGRGGHELLKFICLLKITKTFSEENGRKFHLL